MDSASSSPKPLVVPSLNNSPKLDALQANTRKFFDCSTGALLSSKGSSTISSSSHCIPCSFELSLPGDAISSFDPLEILYRLSLGIHNIHHDGHAFAIQPVWFTGFLNNLNPTSVEFDHDPLMSKKTFKQSLVNPMASRDLTFYVGYLLRLLFSIHHRKTSNHPQDILHHPTSWLRNYQEALRKSKKLCPVSQENFYLYLIWDQIGRAALTLNHDANFFKNLCYHLKYMDNHRDWLSLEAFNHWKKTQAPLPSVCDDSKEPALSQDIQTQDTAFDFELIDSDDEHSQVEISASAYDESFHLSSSESEEDPEENTDPNPKTHSRSSSPSSLVLVEPFETEQPSLPASPTLVGSISTHSYLTASSSSIHSSPVSSSGSVAPHSTPCPSPSGASSPLPILNLLQEANALAFSPSTKPQLSSLSTTAADSPTTSQGAQSTETMGPPALKNS